MVKMGKGVKYVQKGRIRVFSPVLNKYSGYVMIYWEKLQQKNPPNLGASIIPHPQLQKNYSITEILDYLHTSCRVCIHILWAPNF